MNPPENRRQNLRGQPNGIAHGRAALLRSRFHGEGRSNQKPTYINPGSPLSSHVNYPPGGVTGEWRIDDSNVGGLRGLSPRMGRKIRVYPLAAPKRSEGGCPSVVKKQTEIKPIKPIFNPS